MNLPDNISSEDQLDEVLSRPSPRLIESIRALSTPLVVLGASGKMGPSLCLLAQRTAAAAGHALKVVGVSRFSDVRQRRWLEEQGVQTVACDLMDRVEVGKLPDAHNVVYLVGLKFGTKDNPALTWAVNTLAPDRVMEKYRSSRVVALSTGNVYPLVPAQKGGADEETPPSPVGEYAGAALARERIFQHFSNKERTAVALLRLNYAVELRYGVLLDIAQCVWKQLPLDLSTGYLNCLWQGDANELILRSFELAASPPALFNLTGPCVLSVRALAQRFGELMQRPPRFAGTEAETALLSNASPLLQRLGAPSMPLDTILRWTADWVMAARPTLGKPTHFEVRSGDY